MIIEVPISASWPPRPPKTNTYSRFLRVLHLAGEAPLRQIDDLADRVAVDRGGYRVEVRATDKSWSRRRIRPRDLVGIMARQSSTEKDLGGDDSVSLARPRSLSLYASL